MGAGVVPCGKCGGFKTGVYNLHRENAGWNNSNRIRQAPGGPRWRLMMAMVGPSRPVFPDVVVP